MKGQAKLLVRIFFMQLKIKKNTVQIRRAIISFYLVGLAGIFFPPTTGLFVALTPVAQLLSLGILIVYHSAGFNWRTIGIFGFVFITGLAVEIAGVKTNQIFGSYFYGNTLGVRIFDVPVLMGVNWVLMIYLTASIAEKWRINTLFKVFISSFSMIIYDFVLEHVASGMDMWHWQNDEIPARNFVAWFILSLIFHSLLKLFRINTSNELSVLLFLSQIVFFAVLLLKF